MTKSDIAGDNQKTRLIGLPDQGRVWAIVVGLEQYQTRASGSLPLVHYAKNDSEGFASAITAIYPADRIEVIRLQDNEVTKSNLDYELLRTIGALAKDDLFIFYYAGHGFYGAGGNRLTVWDTHTSNIEGTTLLLRDALFDRLERSPCSRSLAFIDACATGFADLVPSRDVLSSLDLGELERFVSPNRYSAIFLSCEPGQKSYPADEYRHGIWTYFLLRALRGEADDALDRGRYLTDVSLRDYLRLEVPRYVTRRLSHLEQQKPRAIVDSSNTFAIRHVPERTEPRAAAGDLTRIRITPEKVFFEDVQRRSVKSLPGFKKNVHFVPDTINNSATQFIRTLLEPEVDDEIQQVYESIKSALNAKRRDIEQKSGGGVGSVDTSVCRFTVKVSQNRSDPTEAVIVRRLELRDGAESFLAQIDQAFGAIFKRIVIQVEPTSLDFDKLVDLFEDLEHDHGGSLRDEVQKNRITYTTDDGMRIRIDLDEGRISIGVRSRSTCSVLLGKVKRYSFGGMMPSQLIGQFYS